MRRAVLCSAGFALALVLTDQVVATGSDAGSAISPSVNRALKADRSLHRSSAPAETVLPTAGRAKAPVPKMPEGCETAVSPLAKSATHAPMARCLS